MTICDTRSRNQEEQNGYSPDIEAVSEASPCDAHFPHTAAKSKRSHKRTKRPTALALIPLHPAFTSSSTTSKTVKPEAKLLPLLLGRTTIAEWWWKTCPCNHQHCRTYCRPLSKNVRSLSKVMLDIDSKGNYHPLAGKNKHLVSVVPAQARLGEEEDGRTRQRRRLHAHDIINFGPSDEPWCRFQVIPSQCASSSEEGGARGPAHSSSSATFLVKPSTHTASTTASAKNPPKESTHRYEPRILLQRDSDDPRDSHNGHVLRVVEQRSSSKHHRKRERGASLLPVVEQDFQTSARLVGKRKGTTEQKEDCAWSTKSDMQDDGDTPKWITPSPKKRKQRLEEIQGSKFCWHDTDDDNACAPLSHPHRHSRRRNLDTDLQKAAETGPQLETQEEYGTNATVGSTRQTSNLVPMGEGSTAVEEGNTPRQGSQVPDIDSNKEEAEGAPTVVGVSGLDLDQKEAATSTSNEDFLAQGGALPNRSFSSCEDTKSRGLGQPTSHCSQMPPPANKQPQKEGLSLTPLQQESSSQELSSGEHCSLSLPMCASSMESGQQDDALLASIADRHSESQHSPFTACKESPERSTEQPPNPLTSVQPWNELKQQEENQGARSSVRLALANLVLARNAQRKDHGGGLLWLPSILGDGFELPIEKKD